MVPGIVPELAVAGRVSSPRVLASGPAARSGQGAGLACSSPGRRQTRQQGPQPTTRHLWRLRVGGARVGLESGGAFFTKGNGAQAETAVTGLRHLSPAAATLTGG